VTIRSDLWPRSDWSKYIVQLLRLTRSFVLSLSAKRLVEKAERFAPWQRLEDRRREVLSYTVYTVSQKKGPTLKRYSSKLYGSILMIFGRNIQKSLE